MYGTVEFLAERVIERAVVELREIREGKTGMSKEKRKRREREIIEFFRNPWFEILLEGSTSLDPDRIRKAIGVE